MADFDGWDADGGEAGGPVQAAGPPVVDGGLLDPRTFPSAPRALTQQAPSIEPAAPEFTGPLDTEVHQQVMQDILNAQAKLPPIVGPADDLTGGQWIEGSPPMFPHGLDSDTHAEVLQDILNAQAKLPPTGSPPNAMIFGGKNYSVLQAETFDPARSNGVTAMPTPEMIEAGTRGAPTVAVPYGPAEKLAYMINVPIPPTPADVDPQTGLASTLRMKPTVFMPSTSWATTGSGNGYDTVRGDPPPDALAIEHGHIDDGPSDPTGQPIRSDGFVDAPSTAYPYGDTKSLSLGKPIPTSTVSNGRVAWHGIDNGRLQFIYPSGSMTPNQVQTMQKNLDQEQRLFLRPK